MAQSKMGELVDQLLRRARGGKLDWHKGVYSNSYVVDFPDISLSIREIRDNVFLFTLINDEGDGIESLRGRSPDPSGEVVGDLQGDDGIESLQGLSPDPSGEVVGDLLREIHNIARRQTFDVDGNIDKALEYLRREQ